MVNRRILGLRCWGMIAALKTDRQHVNHKGPRKNWLWANPSGQQFKCRELCLRAPLIFLEGEAGEEMRDDVAWQRT